MMNIWDIIIEEFNVCKSNKEKKRFIRDLKKIANELKEDLENE